MPWLGILEKMEDPVVLEVATAKLPFVEQGRIWEDRDYVPGRIYSEHRTTEIVPAEALRVMSPEEVAALGVNEKAIEQLIFVASHEPDTRNVVTDELIRSSEREVKRCLDRLAEMGVMDEKTYAKAMEDYEEKKVSVDFADFTENVEMIIGPDEGLPFD